jgi:hypothetical protein
MSVRAMVPLSMPCSFHMYTPSATPMPNTLLQQQGAHSMPAQLSIKEGTEQKAVVTLTRAHYACTCYRIMHSAAQKQLSRAAAADPRSTCWCVASHSLPGCVEVGVLPTISKALHVHTADLVLDHLPAAAAAAVRQAVKQAAPSRGMYQASHACNMHTSHCPTGGDVRGPAGPAGACWCRHSLSSTPCCCFCCSNPKAMPE